MKKQPFLSQRVVAKEGIFSLSQSGCYSEIAGVAPGRHLGTYALPHYPDPPQESAHGTRSWTGDTRCAD